LVWVAAVAAALLGVAIQGFATSAAWTSKSLGANAVAVSRCDSDGVTVTQNLSGSNVVSVTVGSIASACGGASISATVDNGTANSTGSSTVASAGGSVTVTLASAVAAKDADEIDVSITGP
jgi:hypothetical protein